MGGGEGYPPPPPRGLLCHLIAPNGGVSGGKHVHTRTLAVLPNLGSKNVGDKQTLTHARAEDGGRLASALHHGEVRTDEGAVECLTLGKHPRQLLGIVDVGHVSLGDRRDALLGDARQHPVKDGALGIGQIGIALALLHSSKNGLAGDGGGGHGGTPS